MPGPPYLLRGLIEFQISVDQGFTSCLVASQHRPDASQELVERERLGEVVVSALVQGVDLIGDLVAGSEHDDSEIVVEPQATAHLESVKTRHSDIPEHNGWLLCPSDRQPGLPLHS